MSGARTPPEIARRQIVLCEHRLKDALPDDHQARHLGLLPGLPAFPDNFVEMERWYVLSRGTDKKKRGTAERSRRDARPRRPATKLAGR